MDDQTFLRNKIYYTREGFLPFEPEVAMGDQTFLIHKMYYIRAEFLPYDPEVAKSE